MENLLDVKFLSVNETFFEGKAQAVASENNKGPFSILPGHAQFISLIDGKPIKIIDQDGKEHDFNDKISYVLYSAGNQVIIFSTKSTLKVGT